MIVFILVVFALLIIISLIIFIFWYRKEKKPHIEEPKEIISCSEQSIYEHGICLGSNGANCLNSSDCSSNNICLFGTCLTKPSNRNECLSTACGDHLICLDRHLMLLVGNHFIMPPNWWIVKDAITITDGPIKDSIYILTDNLIYLSFANYSLMPIAPSNISSIKIVTIFSFHHILHALGSDYRIYSGLSDHEMSRKLTMMVNNQPLPIDWDWQPISYLAGRDLSSNSIIDIAVANNGYLVLISNDYKLIYDGQKWQEEIGIFREKIKFGINQNNYLAIDNLQLRYVYLSFDGVKYTKQEIVLPNIIDGTITPDGQLIVISRNGLIKYLTIDENEIKDDLLLKGTGHRLLTASNRVWLISDTKCLSV